MTPKIPIDTTPNRTIASLRAIQQAGQPVGPDLVRTMWRRMRFRQVAWTTAGALAVAGSGVGLSMAAQSARMGDHQAGMQTAGATMEGVLPAEGMLVGLGVEARRAEIRALAADMTLPENEIRPTFLAALNDPDPQVRRQSIVAMARRNMNPPVEALYRFIDEDFETVEVADAGDMQSAIQEMAVWRTHSLRAISTALMYHAMRGRAIEQPQQVEKLLKSHDAEVRERAIDTLVRVKDYVLPKSLYKRLKSDSNPMVREALATWAQHHGG